MKITTTTCSDSYLIENEGDAFVVIEKIRLIVRDLMTYGEEYAKDIFEEKLQFTHLHWDDTFDFFKKDCSEMRHDEFLEAVEAFDFEATEVHFYPYTQNYNEWLKNK